MIMSIFMFMSIFMTHLIMDDFGDICISKGGEYKNQVCTLDNKDYYITNINDLNKKRTLKLTYKNDTRKQLWYLDMDDLSTSDNSNQSEE